MKIECNKDKAVFNQSKYPIIGKIYCEIY